MDEMYFIINANNNKPVFLFDKSFNSKYSELI